MDLHAEKLELIRMVLETDNPNILAIVKKFLTESKKDDFWDKLPQYQRDEILKGVEEAAKGETVDYENIITKIRR